MVRLHCREQLVPDQIHYGLHVANAAGDYNHSIELRDNHAILTESSITTITVVPGTPELITVSLIPIAIRRRTIRGLPCGRLFDPLRRDYLFALPLPFLQIQLSEACDVLRAQR